MESELKKMLKSSNDYKEGNSISFLEITKEIILNPEKVNEIIICDNSNIRRLSHILLILSIIIIFLSMTIATLRKLEDINNLIEKHEESFKIITNVVKHIQDRIKIQL